MSIVGNFEVVGRNAKPLCIEFINDVRQVGELIISRTYCIQA
jgi:hypothetical protein